MLLALLAINTFVCTTNRVVQLLAAKGSAGRMRLALKLAPHIMHYGLIVILAGYLASLSVISLAWVVPCLVLADVVGDVGLTGSADARGTTIAAQAAPRAMKPRVERPNGTARVMESSFVLAASVFPGLWVCFARADTAVTQATKVAGQPGPVRRIFAFVN